MLFPAGKQYGPLKQNNLTKDERGKETMERKCKAIIHKLSYPMDGCLNYDVSLWYEWRNTYVYAGYGKYFCAAEDAEQYAKENATEEIIKDY